MYRYDPIVMSPLSSSLSFLPPFRVCERSCFHYGCLWCRCKTKPIRYVLMKPKKKLTKNPLMVISDGHSSDRHFLFTSVEQFCFLRCCCWTIQSSVSVDHRLLLSAVFSQEFFLDSIWALFSSTGKHVFEPQPR